jgi:hypothetical protein
LGYEKRQHLCFFANLALLYDKEGISKAFPFSEKLHKARHKCFHDWWVLSWFAYVLASQLFPLGSSSGSKAFARLSRCFSKLFKGWLGSPSKLDVAFKKSSRSYLSWWLCPLNVVFDGDQAAGIIDFDATHPGPRTWDIAYALYRFAPFTNPDNEDGFGSIEDQISRARLFCDAYGLTKENRMGLTELMIERLETLLNFLTKSAQDENRKFEQNIQDGHHLKYLADIEYLKLHKLAIQARLTQLDSKI